MSHLSNVDNITITDLDILTKACEGLSLTLDRKQKSYSSSWTDKIDCDAVIRDKTEGEAAVVAKKDSAGYDISWDKYQNSLRDKIGEKCNLLGRAYSVEAVIKQANAIGMVNSVETQVDGSVIVQGVFI